MTVSSTFFVTTAIDYTNGAPHLGHAYEKVLADVLARYHRLKGQEVFFLTGVDQHGQKVQQSAEKQGISPQAFVDTVTAQFLALWQKLGLRYDGWAATTGEQHKRCVRTILQRLWDDRDPATGESRWIYKASRGGYYSVRQEQFLTDKERGADGQFGPEWGQVEFREEENYYFRLEGSKQWLLDLIDSRSRAGTPLVVPDFRVAELRNAVEKLAGDLCISRPKARLSWGIEFPFDADYVTYVWFDALVNYISFAPGYDATKGADLTEFKRWWPALNIIGKDILIPAHGIYWPIMLRALGFEDEEIPTLLVHGWWNIDGEKMSKSQGNSVDPGELADRHGPEALRYYLMSDIATGRDADFSEDRLVQRYNADLAKNIGNLLNRTLNMIQKYRAGELKKPTSEPGSSGLAAAAAATVEAVEEGMESCQVHAVTNAIVNFASQANAAIEAAAPWKLAKDPGAAGALDDVLYSLAESLRIIAVLLSPFIPNAAQGILRQLHWRAEVLADERSFGLADAAWGGLPDGHRVDLPVPLFPQIEVAKPTV